VRLSASERGFTKHAGKAILYPNETARVGRVTNECKADSIFMSNTYREPSRRRSADHARSSGSKHPRKSHFPLVLAIFWDIFAAALLLGIFYVTNYKIKPKTNPITLPTPAPMTTVMPAPTQTLNSGATAGPDQTEAVPTAEPTVDPNDWRAKFSDKFTSGAVEETDRSYRSANVSIEIRELEKYDTTCFVADIYIADLKYLKSAFAGDDPMVMGYREFTDVIAEQNGGILAITGDHCVDNPGPVVRNGVLFTTTSSSADILVMHYDGSMEVFTPDEFDIDRITSQGAYQVWNFGPMLLDDGLPMTSFNSTVTGLNPRVAIGYYEPGHYCFVVVGGRQETYSEGLTMVQLSELMHELGCSVAYNLDGGQSAEMIFHGEMLNEQGAGRRKTTDIIYIGDE